jgi:microsomal epoxide hydrolase
VHVIHARSAEPGALPLVLTHGWPGSVAEFVKVIDPLRDPTAHGGDPADAFHVVVPSLPGYGFSGPTTEPGWSSRRIGRAWAELLTQLGYERFGAHGGDWGSPVAHFLAEAVPERVVGVHVTLITAPRPGASDDFDGMTGRELRMRALIDDHKATGRGYQAIQTTQPQTLAYALNDSPVGLLSWIVEKFRAWTDNDGDVFDAVTRDELLTDVSIYWFTQTIGSSMRLYAESRRAGMALPPITVPLGFAAFPAEITGARRAWVAAHHNLVHWTELDRGGHFAALEEPDLLVADIRDFFRSLRT